MVMIKGPPEGGKEDAVSHWERQSQFLFCKIRMMKITMMIMITMIMMRRRMISHWLRRSWVWYPGCCCCCGCSPNHCHLTGRQKEPRYSCLQVKSGKIQWNHAKGAKIQLLAYRDIIVLKDMARTHSWNSLQSGIMVTWPIGCETH